MPLYASSARPGGGVARFTGGGADHGDAADAAGRGRDVDVAGAHACDGLAAGRGRRAAVGAVAPGCGDGRGRHLGVLRARR